MKLHENIKQIKSMMGITESTIEKDIRIIKSILDKHKPEGVDMMEFDIEPTEGRYEYYIKPQYIIDKNDGDDLMKIIWKSDNEMDWETKGDQIFQQFEKDMVKFIRDFTGLYVYFRGRGVTEKEYWLSQQNQNKFPNF